VLTGGFEAVDVGVVGVPVVLLQQSEDVFCKFNVKWANPIMLVKLFL
jgi:hypothetical protein